MEEQELWEALELAAGRRLNRTGYINERQNVNRNDVIQTKTMISLFLESLPGEMCIAELRSMLEDID